MHGHHQHQGGGAGNPDQHSHHHGHHGHHHHGHPLGQANQQSPQEYFEKFEKLRQNNRQLYWMEIIRGTALEKMFEKWNLDFLRSLNCQMMMGVVGMAQMMVTCECMPLVARPFISGLFLPLLLIVFLNYNVLVGFDNDTNRSANYYVMLFPLVMFALTAIRSSGSHSNKTIKEKAVKIYEVRPYLQNPQMQCRQCQIPKSFRTFHCPICKVCVPKFTRHSLIFGICVGAANQLLAMLFFLALSMESGYVLIKFFQLSQFGLITKVMMYGMNGYIFYASLWEVLTFFVLNLYYGATEFELQNWMMMQYMMKVPARQFENNCNNGFSHNFMESMYALFGFAGYEGMEEKFYRGGNKDDESGALNEQISNENLLQFPHVDPSKKYVVNWDKAFMYLIPHMPNYKRRDEVITMMKRDEPRMIQSFKMIKQFRQEAKRQNPSFNDIQLQQTAMRKMQQHIMKNGPPAHMMKPNPEQQKMIQLQMLAHMKNQFPDGQIKQKLILFQKQLKDNTISPEEVSQGIRQIQQQIMQQKMQEVLRQQQQQQKQKQQREKASLIDLQKSEEREMKKDEVDLVEANQQAIQSDDSA